MKTGIRGWVRAAAAAVALAFAGHASAVTIAYEATQLGGTEWRYDYHVTNDAGADPLQEFAITFALGSFANLRDVISPAGWDALIGVIDPALPDNGYVDWCAYDGTSCAGPGLAGGETLAGFAVIFDWLGEGTPGSQPFDVITPEPFAIVASGVTVPFERPLTSVDEPASARLFALALLGFAFSLTRTTPRRGVARR